MRGPVWRGGQPLRGKVCSQALTRTLRAISSPSPGVIALIAGLMAKSILDVNRDCLGVIAQ